MTIRRRLLEIIPWYSEQEAIPALLAALVPLEQRVAREWEIIFIDDAAAIIP